MSKKYKGMTVNERLYMSGLADKFDLAVQLKNVQQATSILQKVELSHESILEILQSLRINFEFIAITPDENEIVGNWIAVDGKVYNDQLSNRIEYLIDNCLKKISTDKSGWNFLYQDINDRRFWELIYRNGHYHGGGPKALYFIEKKVAIKKYNIEANNSEILASSE